MGGAPPSKGNKSDASQPLPERYPSKRAETIEHLDFALSEFPDIKMRPWLEPALRHEEIVKA
ncbi:hypothetical protein ACFLW7_03780 [Chloroflexota bacterium]